MKKTILHVIYSLGRGGAETMLVRVLKELTDYRNIVITFDENNHFKEELICDKLICINTPSLLSILTAAKKIRKIIKEEKAAIIHSHLPLCNFAARLAVPCHIPLLTTIHTSVATANDYKKWHIRFLDKVTYRLKKSTIIGVSSGALKDYFSFLNLKPGKAEVLYTFVDTQRYYKKIALQTGNKFLLVSVGALRKGKNFLYLIDAIQKLNNPNVELHIFGIGPEEAVLQEAILKNDVPVFLKGQVTNLQEFLPEYDMYIMPSLFEGFSLSVLEAMAVGLPMMLSNIPSFREQCEDRAVYFDTNNPQDFIQKFNELYSSPTRRKELADKAHVRLLENFTLDHHMHKLLKIYEDALSRS